MFHNFLICVWAQWQFWLSSELHWMWFLNITLLSVDLLAWLKLEIVHMYLWNSRVCVILFTIIWLCIIHWHSVSIKQNRRSFHSSFNEKWKLYYITHFLLCHMASASVNTMWNTVVWLFFYSTKLLLIQDYNAEFSL